MFTSFFDRLGAEAAVNAAVDGFYVKARGLLAPTSQFLTLFLKQVLGDAKLAPFFESGHGKAEEPSEEVGREINF